MNLPTRNERHQFTFTTEDGRKIKFAPWLVKHEQEYLYATEGVEDRNVKLEHIEELVSKCIDESIKLDSLSEIDFYRLIIELRKKSKGNDHEIIFTCPYCSTINDVKYIDLEKDTKYTPFNKEPIEINDITFNCTDITRAELKSIQELKNKHKQRFMYLVHSVKSIVVNDNVYNNISEKDVKKYIEEELTPDEFQLLSKEFITRMGDIGISKLFECSKCKKQTSVYIDDITDFFV